MTLNRIRSSKEEPQHQMQVNIKDRTPLFGLAQSAEAAEYTDCISAEG